MARLECRELSAVPLRQRNIIEPFEQAALLQWMDFERVWLPVGAGHGLLRQIDFDGSADLRVKLPAHLAGDLRWYAHRQQAVLQAIAREDVAKARCNDRAESKGMQRIDRAFPRRSATEVALRHDDPGVAIRLPIEDEIGMFGALGIEAPVVEQDALVIRTARHLVEARGTKLVGIDVDLVDRHRNGFEHAKRLHDQPRCKRVRTSVNFPVSAAAAAIAGLIK